MKYKFCKDLMLGALLLAGSAAGVHAQGFSVPWFVVAGGGGTTSTTNGGISITGTFGQWDATAQPLANAEFSLSGGFWSNPQILEIETITPPPPETTTILFSNSFIGNSLTNFTTNGDIVVQTGGMVVVSNNAPNNGGVLTSVPFVLNNSTGLITITRDVTVHAAPNPPNTPTNYGAYDFMGQFGITVGTVPSFSVNYDDWDYSDPPYMARYGFFLASDGASSILIADQANVSAALTTFLQDTNSIETVTYNPTNGLVGYSIGTNVLVTNFFVGTLPATDVAPTMTLTFNVFGPAVGDFQSMSNLVVTQAPGLTNSTAIIALSGNLAFGNVAVNTSSNQTLTISNLGNSTLTVSNITFTPAGGFVISNFSGPIAIAPGGSTNLIVTFSPITPNSVFGGTVTVVSDATSGANTIPFSGYVTSSTALQLAVVINGTGTVAPKDNGKTFKLNTKISLKATPGSGQAFAGWTGSIVSFQNPLVFNITSAMVLQANFVTSPFASATETFDGLFGTTNGTAEATSGMLKGLTVSSKGVYSGSLLISGASHTISGTFVASGQASNYISRTSKQGGSLSVEMVLNLNDFPPVITGTVSNALTASVADLVAYRTTNVNSGQYTMLLEPTILDNPAVPPGYGYALISQKAGVMTISGNLADGTALNQSVPVTQGTDGSEVPIYDSIYGGTGLLTGWLNLTNGTLNGNLDWIKAAAKSGLYTAGFTNAVIAQGESWTPPAAKTPAIALNNGQLDISGGTLLSPISFNVEVTDKNALTKILTATNNATNSLIGSINPKTGLLTITFGNGAKKATTAGKGAVLQSSIDAGGYFLDKTNAGSIILTNLGTNVFQP